MPVDSNHLVADPGPETSTQRVASVPERIAASSRSAYTWVKGNPVVALLFLTIAGTLVYFFGFLPLFTNGRWSTANWAWEAWNPGTNYEHARLIPPIGLFLIWMARD